MSESERSIEGLVEAYGSACTRVATVRQIGNYQRAGELVGEVQRSERALLRAVARLREENEGLARVVRWCHDNHGPLVQERAALTPKGGDRE